MISDLALRGHAVVEDQVGLNRLIPGRELLRRAREPTPLRVARDRVVFRQMYGSAFSTVMPLPSAKPTALCAICCTVVMFGPGAAAGPAVKGAGAAGASVTPAAPMRATRDRDTGCDCDKTARQTATTSSPPPTAPSRTFRAACDRFGCGGHAACSGRNNRPYGSLVIGSSGWLGFGGAAARRRPQPPVSSRRTRSSRAG